MIKLFSGTNITWRISQAAASTLLCSEGDLAAKLLRPEPTDLLTRLRPEFLCCRHLKDPAWVVGAHKQLFFSVVGLLCMTMDIDFVGKRTGTGFLGVPSLLLSRLEGFDAPWFLPSISWAAKKMEVLQEEKSNSSVYWWKQVKKTGSCVNFSMEAKDLFVPLCLRQNWIHRNSWSNGTIQLKSSKEVMYLGPLLSWNLNQQGDGRYSVPISPYPFYINEEVIW